KFHSERVAPTPHGRDAAGRGTGAHRPRASTQRCGAGATGSAGQTELHTPNRTPAVIGTKVVEPPLSRTLTQRPSMKPCALAKAPNVTPRPSVSATFVSDASTTTPDDSATTFRW